MDPPRRRYSRLPAEVWHRFIAIVRQRGARAPAARWYVLRAEQFGRTLQVKDLRTCDATDVTRARRAGAD
jgi:hypothetical protein